MQYIEAPYYVGLLTAAMYHGSAHHAPQVFQVVTTSPRRMIHCGRVRIQFFTSRKMPDKNFLDQRKVQTGYMQISKPEFTCLDLVKNARKCGGLNHVGLVVSELCELLSKKKIADLLDPHNDTSTIQRLGFLIDAVSNGDITSLLHKKLFRTDQKRTRLDPSASWTGSYNEKWAVIENIPLEVEEI